MVNGFDAEFIASGEIELTGNPENVSALTLETNIIAVDQGTTHTKELETKKRKNQKKVSQSHQNTMFLHIL